MKARGAAAVLRKALAPQQLGSGKAIAACGQENLEDALGDGSGHAAVTQ